MKKAHMIFSIIVALSILLLAGCKANEPAAANAAKPASSAASNANDTPPANSPAAALANANSSKESADSSKEAPKSDSKETPELIGTYEAREIDDNGVVTLISQIETVISFSATGTYSRASQAKGKTYHSDSGQFHIVPPNKLVLTIQVSKKSILKPPVERTHTFTLSPDGDELKLTSDKGATAIFHRISKPKAP